MPRRRRRFGGLELRAWALLGAGFVFLVLAVSSREGEPAPRRPEDACEIFAEKPHWYRASHAAARRWGVSESIQLAIIRHESGFLARARPPRRRWFFFLPGPRRSSAFGYAQALDATWDEFKAETGSLGARRDRFVDIADFVAWYGSEAARVAEIPLDDARSLYLAYHEGPAGYRRGSHRAKPWLLGVASRVAAQAETYERQLDRCRDDLRRTWPRWVVAGIFVALVLAVALSLRGGPRPRHREKPR